MMKQYTFKFGILLGIIGLVSGCGGNGSSASDVASSSARVEAMGGLVIGG